MVIIDQRVGPEGSYGHRKTSPTPSPPPLQSTLPRPTPRHPRITHLETNVLMTITIYHTFIEAIETCPSLLPASFFFPNTPCEIVSLKKKIPENVTNNT